MTLYAGDVQGSSAGKGNALPPRIRDMAFDLAWVWLPGCALWRNPGPGSSPRASWGRGREGIRPSANSPDRGVSWLPLFFSLGVGLGRRPPTPGGVPLSPYLCLSISMRPHVVKNQSDGTGSPGGAAGCRTGLEEVPAEPGQEGSLARGSLVLGGWIHLKSSK